MSMLEDLDLFFSQSEFATTAYLGGVEILGIFESAYALASVGMAGMASENPVFTTKTSLIGPDVVGQAIVIGDVQYSVAEHQPDGTGISLLVLERYS